MVEQVVGDRRRIAKSLGIGLAMLGIGEMPRQDKRKGVLLTGGQSLLRRAEQSAEWFVERHGAGSRFDQTLH